MSLWTDYDKKIRLAWIILYPLLSLMTLVVGFLEPAISPPFGKIDVSFENFSLPVPFNLPFLSEIIPDLIWLGLLYHCAYRKSGCALLTSYLCFMGIMFLFLLYSLAFGTLQIDTSHIEPFMDFIFPVLFMTLNYLLLQANKRERNRQIRHSHQYTDLMEEFNKAINPEELAILFSNHVRSCPQISRISQMAYQDSQVRFTG